MTMQKFCKREQNHQVYLNVLPSAAEFYAKVLVFFKACNEIRFGLLAKVALPYVSPYYLLFLHPIFF
jgi:hypothetical protein